jgi:gluconokinase
MNEKAKAMTSLANINRPFIIIVMGVCASGKSTVASRLATLLNADTLDADAFHSAANVAKMQSGTPLTGVSVVLACSALKRRYRDVLRSAHDSVRFVHLVAPQSVIEERVRQRVDHFMPVSLVASQFEALEPLQSDEVGVEIDVSERSVDQVVAEARMSASQRLIFQLVF